MIFTPLTREELEAMPSSVFLTRRRELARLVEALRRDHYARYQGPRDAQIRDWVETRKAAAVGETYWGSAS